jgi:hypothetical protein
VNTSRAYTFKHEYEFVSVFTRACTRVLHVYHYPKGSALSRSRITTSREELEKGSFFTLWESQALHIIFYFKVCLYLRIYIEIEIKDGSLRAC